MVLKIVKDDKGAGKHHGDANAEQEFKEYILRQERTGDTAHEQDHGNSSMHPALPPYLLCIGLGGQYQFFSFEHELQKYER
jgi:hypothetical protein